MNVKSYTVEGMTCDGCRKSVEKQLLEVEGVERVDVDLENKKAEVHSHQSISIQKLQNSLSSKYQIKEIDQKNMSHDQNIFDHKVQEEQQSKFQQLRPLFLILCYLAVATVLLNYNRTNWDGAMLDFMGLFFIVFSFFKLLDLKGFPASFSMYDPLAKRLPAYGWMYPFIETVLGLCFLMRLFIPEALIITLIVLGITTIGVVKTLVDKRSIKCACLGTALNLPMTEATFIENAIMIVMAVFMLFSYF
ncbi:heavy metal transporter [Nonlabens spongiae]|uniref:Heavy metal transporter n=1 Tax=Nonlabens spongiae TaxID=331648 RepID=A0A1W6MGJ5_9FLAO|nr:heavy metal-associated domain-containing protein [Nonlabens spongiae]ARN76700.1 heavy metal transporter [Nonlabens spongiae]